MKSLNPYMANVSNVIEFLQCQFENKAAAYGSLNNHRSALSLILPEDIGENLLLKRFIKGTFRKRPPKARYNTTWDPEVVLSFLVNVQEDTLKNISSKLATLLLLATGHRVQTISLIKISNIIKSKYGIQILIPDLIKTSNSHNKQPCLAIPFFNQNPKLCVASLLIKYIEMTKDIRKDDADFLFLTFKQPYKCASKDTISRWIKETLQRSGVDTSVFRPHSTRHASSSAALRQGISIENIRQAASWSENSSTFYKFYNRPVSSSSLYAQKILELGS